MKKFGLIGSSLSHSFSPSYFKSKFEEENIKASYDAFEIDHCKEVASLISKHNLNGLNVTIPYKQSIIPFLDEVDPKAQNIGAVNTIKIDEGKLIGYNTDVIGFRKSMRAFIGYKPMAALILGTGGASQAVQHALRMLDTPYLLVSRNTRSGDLSYDGLTKRVFDQYHIIINTTPVGTFPAVNESPEIPYQHLSDKHFVFDLVYNPEKSKFLQQAQKQGAHIKSGLEMLQIQAEESWRIWMS